MTNLKIVGMGTVYAVGVLFMMIYERALPSFNGDQAISSSISRLRRNESQLKTQMIDTVDANVTSFIDTSASEDFFLQYPHYWISLTP